MKKISIVFSVFLFAACAVKLSEPMQADATRVSGQFPNFTVENLQSGKRIYTENCASCHKLAKPSAFSEADWRKIVPNMVAKVNKKNPNKINTADEDVLLKYLLTMGPLSK